MAQVYKTEPRPYQRLIVEKTAEAPNLALFLKQGLGKTKIALDSAAVMYEAGELEALIVLSRTTVIENWYHNEIPAHLGIPYTSVLYSARNKGTVPKMNQLKAAKGLKIILMNDGCARTHGKDYLAEVLATFKTGFIVDESTLIKNPGAQIGKIVVKLGEKAPWKRILCGEPAPQGPVDYFNQYKFLSPKIIGVGTFTAYKNVFCEQKEIWVNGRQIMQPTRAFTEAGQPVFEANVKPYTIRLRKEDVLPDLPEKQYIVRAYELPSNVRKMYDRLKNEFMTELLTKDCAGTLTATLAISRLTRLHQMVSGHVIDDNGRLLPIEAGRFEVLCDIIDERPEDAKTIVWAHYRHTIEQLFDALEERYGRGTARVVYGGLSSDERTGNLDSFKRDARVRFLIANPATAGWGLTLTESDTAVYYSNSYNWEHRDQSEDRIHRIGQQSSSVTYYDIVAVNTVDQKILDVLQSKADFSKSVLKNYAEWLG